MEIGIVAHPLEWVGWPAARNFLEPALKRSDEDWSNILPELAEGHLQLWAVLQSDNNDCDILYAAAITRIVTTQAGEVAEIHLVGGRDFDLWIADLSEIIAHSAKEIGCIAVRAYGRTGWRRPLAKLGWQEKTVAYEKALKEN
ncbi:MAG: hypothetical protein ABF760_03910 [Zymomonas mobilis]